MHSIDMYIQWIKRCVEGQRMYTQRTCTYTQDNTYRHAVENITHAYTFTQTEWKNRVEVRVKWRNLQWMILLGSRNA